MTGERLDAADREHEAPPRIGPVGAERHYRGDIEGADDLAGGADLDFLPKPRTDQRVVDEQQALAERHAQMVGEFERCRAGTALGAVDDDIVRENASLQHGLDECTELPRRAPPNLET